MDQNLITFHSSVVIELCGYLREQLIAYIKKKHGIELGKTRNPFAFNKGQELKDFLNKKMESYSYKELLPEKLNLESVDFGYFPKLKSECEKKEKRGFYELYYNVFRIVTDSKDEKGLYDFCHRINQNLPKEPFSSVKTKSKDYSFIDGEIERKNNLYEYAQKLKDTNWYFYAHAYPRISSIDTSILRLHLLFREEHNGNVIAEIINDDSNEQGHRHYSYIGRTYLELSEEGIVVCNFVTKKKVKGIRKRQLNLKFYFSTDGEKGFSKFALGQGFNYEKGKIISYSVVLRFTETKEENLLPPKTIAISNINKEGLEDTYLRVIATYLKEKELNYIRTKTDIDTFTDLEEWMKYKGKL